MIRAATEIERERIAARMAYNAGLGASEWEAFIDRVPLTIEDTEGDDSEATR